MLLVAVARSAGAQSPAGMPDTTVVRWIALTTRPHLRDTTSTAGIYFPSMMREAGVGGEVRLQMIVGLDGKPDPQSIRVISSTHDIFTVATRSAVSRWEFAPPTLDGRGVRILVPVTVSFVVPSIPRDEPSREVAGIVADTSGIHVSLGAVRIPQDSSIVANRADRRAATEAVLSELLSTATTMVAGAVCLANDSLGKVPANLLRHLRQSHPDLRSAARCPRTYASMIVRVDSLGRPLEPPTRIADPVWIEASRMRPWTRDLYLLDGLVRQGLATQRYACTARRERPVARWRAKCRLTVMSISRASRKGAKGPSTPVLTTQKGDGEPSPSSSIPARAIHSDVNRLARSHWRDHVATEGVRRNRNRMLARGAAHEPTLSVDECD